MPGDEELSRGQKSDQKRSYGRFWNLVLVLLDSYEEYYRDPYGSLCLTA